ncbi:protein obstructor-E [Culex quinquefasciatus]|uniref:protein obstructor-E n=1 Tax=Culex quinquefasciatus TaxID=7176 RepID=UPI0018E3551E|nr:protein obstructor-E [Culex quinquefasciatus]
MFALTILLVTLTLAGVTPTDLPDVQCHPTDTHFVDDPRACNKYFTCYRGEPISQLCPPGFRFVESMQACYEASVEQCFPCPEQGLHFFAHPKSCGKYVMCHTGVPTEKVCSEGMLFNPAVGQCDLEERVTCEV